MEVALWTTERIDAPGLGNTAPYRKMRGSIVVAIPLAQIRRKWVEICGNMLSPRLRADWLGVRGAEALVANWQESWATAWRGMNDKKKTPAQAWAEIAADHFPDLGNDPNGDVPLEDTWGWTTTERKLFCLGKIATEDGEIAKKIRYTRNTVETLGYANTIDYRTELGLTQQQIDNIEDPRRIVHPDLSTTWAANKVEPTCDPGDVIETSNG